MKEITNTCCLHHVSGGYGWQGDPNCPGCNGDWEDKPVINLNNWGGRNAGALSVVGGAVFNKVGSVMGFVVGSVIDITNFENLGENYKANIMSSIKNGNIPAD